MKSKLAKELGKSTKKVVVNDTLFLQTSNIKVNLIYKYGL